MKEPVTSILLGFNFEEKINIILIIISAKKRFLNLS